MYSISEHSPSDPIIALNVKNSAGGTNSLYVHQGIISKSSKFLQNVMMTLWAGPREQPNAIDLSEDCMETVKIYIGWLYTDEVPIKRHEQGEDMGEMGADEAEQIYVLLAKAYVSGEKIFDIKYKNMVLELIGKASRSSAHYPASESISIIYEGTPSNSQLRNLIADEYEMHLIDKPEQSDCLDFLDALPKQALADILKATIRERQPTFMPAAPIEYYFEKEDLEHLFI